MTTTERRVKRVATTPELSLVHTLVTILLPPDGNLGVTNSLQTARREEEKCGAKLCMLHSTYTYDDTCRLSQHCYTITIAYTMYNDASVVWF